jgi:hypothetical protein
MTATPPDDSGLGEQGADAVGPIGFGPVGELGDGGDES